MGIIIGLIYAALGAATVGTLSAAAAGVMQRRAAPPTDAHPSSRVPSLRLWFMGVNGALLIALYVIVLDRPSWARWPFFFINGLVAMSIVALILILLEALIREQRRGRKPSPQGLVLVGMLSNCTSIFLGWVVILGMSDA